MLIRLLRHCRLPDTQQLGTVSLVSEMKGYSTVDPLSGLSFNCGIMTLLVAFWATGRGV